jgi:hypothetical protein
MTDKMAVQVGAVLVLTLLTGYFIHRMNSTDQIIQVLKYGFGLVCSTIHLMGAMYGGRKE